jgi:hypothetical protein
MKLITTEQLVPNTLYYIQSPQISGNGKQMGIFTGLYEPYPEIKWAVFDNVSDVTGKFHSGYAIGHRIFRCDLCTFYLPERNRIMERNFVNGALKSITGDPCFVYY